ncbi:MAG: nitrile hydratase accessory protein [Gammaproteobacteria bacterium]|nr:MAG: nitrile hydratase accessory protein [Gammaproteobacteria bacterium]
MSKPVDLSLLPALPVDDEGPVFAQPWQAQAFAMTLELHRAGHFSWKEWAEHLSVEIAAARERGDPDRGDTYYHHWLAALEKLVAVKGLASTTELGTRKRQWDVAARNTPHGQPIELGNG